MANADTLKEKIQDYVHKRGFGSMNKNDFEVFIFDQLLKTDEKCIGKSDFVISRYLRIPETKVKRLRYEANLVYVEDVTDGGNAFKDKFYKVLKERVYKSIDDDKIQFSITDKMLRLYLDDKLESYGSYADSSFNSNIVTITASDLILLIADFENNKEIIDIVKTSIYKTGTKLPDDKRKAFVEGVMAVMKDVGRQIAPNVTSFILDNVQRIGETQVLVNNSKKATKKR